MARLVSLSAFAVNKEPSGALIFIHLWTHTAPQHTGGADALAGLVGVRDAENCLYVVVILTSEAIRRGWLRRTSLPREHDPQTPKSKGEGQTRQAKQQSQVPKWPP